MAKQHTFKEVADLLKLTPEEFERMVPDLVAWYELASGLEAMIGAKAQNFIWVDDGKPGEVFAVDLHIVSTDETHTLKGTAYTEDGGNPL